MSGDLVYHAARNLFDTAIIYTEDSDFAYSINKAKELGKHVEICSFADSQQRDLIREGDSFIHLDKVLEKYAEKIFPQEIKSNVVNLPAEKKIVEKKPEEPPVKRPRGRPKTKGILDGLKKSSKVKMVPGQRWQTTYKSWPDQPGEPTPDKYL